MSMAVNPAWIGRSVDKTVRTLQALQSGSLVLQVGVRVEKRYKFANISSICEVHLKPLFHLSKE